MGFWRFADPPSLEGLQALVPTYNYTLGWVAGLMAVIAGLALFPTLLRVRSATTALSRRAWHLGGAATMGIGFWGTQNMALLGFELPASYYYAPAIGFAALLPAIGGCAAAIRVLRSRSNSLVALQLGALSLAAGLAGMHYTLMEAIRGDIVFTYDASSFGQSLVLGYGFALVALYVNRVLDNPGWPGWSRRLIGSLVLGVMVLGNHFAAMAGVTFYDDPAVTSGVVSSIPAYLIPTIAACVLFIVTAYWVGSIVDGRLAEATAALRRSEARHRAVIETMLDAHLVVDRESVVRAFNPAAETMYGWPAAEIIGRPVSLLINAPGIGGEQRFGATDVDHQDLGQAARRWVHADGGRRRDGSTFPIEIAVSPFFVDGERYVSCAVRDLGDSWEAEARLRRLAAAIEQAGDAVCILDGERRIQYVNPQYERQTGYASGEVVGATPGRSVEEDRVYAEIWDTVQRGRPWTGQLRSRRRDGSVAQEETSITPVLDGRGAVTGYVAVMRDITRRLEDELERRRLAEALRHCTDGIEILDNQGRIVYVNAAYEAASGQRLADIRGSRPEALLDFGPAAESYEDMMRTAYRGGRPWSGTLKTLDLAGELREEEVTVSPMRDERGQVTGFVVVKRDISDRRRLEAQARQRQRLQSIGQLADGIAHELAAPMQRLNEALATLAGHCTQFDRLLAELGDLASRPGPVATTTVAACLQRADADYLRREIGAYLDRSRADARELAGIVHAMHEISHTGNERAGVDINRAIQSAITVTASEWKPVAEVRTELDPALPSVEADAAEIGLVLLSLIVNAAHAIAGAAGGSLRGKGVIAIGTRRVGEAVEIRVSDTGPAIDPETRRRLFDPQFAGAVDGGREGLALLHDLVTARLGGSVALDEATTRGAAFTIRLPLSPPATAAGSVAA